MQRERARKLLLLERQFRMTMSAVQEITFAEGSEAGRLADPLEITRWSDAKRQNLEEIRVEIRG